MGEEFEHSLVALFLASRGSTLDIAGLSTSVDLCHAHVSYASMISPSCSGFVRTLERVRGRRVPRHSPWRADRTLLG
eukprot:130952-Pleurochrysis_carterae.AAC.2